MCVLRRSAAEPRVYPSPKGAAFSQARKETVQESSWVWKDAGVTDARADIPAPGCCQHAFPGHGADSMYPAKTDGRLKDPAIGKSFPFLFRRYSVCPLVLASKAITSGTSFPGSQRSPSPHPNSESDFPPQTMRTHRGVSWEAEVKAALETSVPFYNQVSNGLWACAYGERG